MKKNTLLLSLIILICMGTINSLHAQVGIITTIAGGGSAGDSSMATDAHLTPFGVAVDASGNIYVTEKTANKVRKFRKGDIITTYAGTGVASYSGDGGLAVNAKLSSPTGITISSTGNIYFADAGNTVVRKINTSGYISRVAGSHVTGFSGMGGPADSARINGVAGLCFDAAGNLFIADNNTRVLQVNTSDTINLFAGTGAVGYSGDGIPALLATFNGVESVTMDVFGNLYIADYHNSLVRKVNPAGTVTTFAGNHTAGTTGDGGPATAASINRPVDIKTDAHGNLFILDAVANKIRRVSTSGIISTICGNGTGTDIGDGGPAIDAVLNNPTSMWIDDTGNIYVADNGNQRVREIAHGTSASVPHIARGLDISIYPNPTSGSFTIYTDELPQAATIDILNVSGTTVYHASLLSKETTIDLREPPGTYFVRILSASGNTVQKISVR